MWYRSQDLRVTVVPLVPGIVGESIVESFPMVSLVLQTMFRFCPHTHNLTLTIVTTNKVTMEGPLSATCRTMLSALLLISRAEPCRPWRRNSTATLPEISPRSLVEKTCTGKPARKTVRLDNRVMGVSDEERSPRAGIRFSEGFEIQSPGWVAEPIQTCGSIAQSGRGSEFWLRASGEGEARVWRDRLSQTLPPAFYLYLPSWFDGEPVPVPCC